MKTLTKDQAIKRIKDIKENKSCDHLFEITGSNVASETGYVYDGAIAELMAIFDITEEELNK